MNKAGVKKVGITRSYKGQQDINKPAIWLGSMVALLLAAPKLRLMVGPAPLYAIDAMIAYLFVLTRSMPKIKWSLLDVPLPSLISYYIMFVWLGEMRGLLTYGAVMESVYITVEFSLAISLFFIIPKIIRDEQAVAMVLKGIVFGLVFTSIITIMYSLSPTRSVVVKVFFSHDFFVPYAERLAQKLLFGPEAKDALRGNSLIGTSTITTGFLGTMWAFAFLAARWPGIEGKWRSLAHAAAVITPIGMLMTYGRAAWLTVIVLGVMSFVLGLAKSRRYLIVLVIALAILVYRVGWESELFMVDRVVNKTEMAIENPYEEESFAQRLKSFSQPFSHLLDHPIWLIIGAGRVGQKLSQRGNIGTELLDQAGLSKHSGFGMAYYCYGFLAAIVHVLIMLNGIRLIFKHLQDPRPQSPLYKITWQTFLMAWIGLLFWWLPGHAMIGEARGVILFFFFYGFMAAVSNMSERRLFAANTEMDSGIQMLKTGTE